jgi:hypothetical protein
MSADYAMKETALQSRYSTSIKSRVSTISAATHRLEKELGRHPSIAEIGDDIVAHNARGEKIPRQAIAAALEAMADPLHLDWSPPDRSTADILAFPHDEALVGYDEYFEGEPDDEAEAVRQENLAKLRRRMVGLTPKVRHMLTRYLETDDLHVIMEEFGYADLTNTRKGIERALERLEAVDETSLAFKLRLENH